MSTELTSFLQHHTPVAKESAVWGDGTMPLTITSYISQELPPLEFVTSVRAVVLRQDQVLVVRDPGGYHIVPGGRREANETLLQTLQREMQEETGWSLTNIKLIGFKHFHHLSSVQETWPIYPDFLQVIYRGEPAIFNPEAREKNGYELGADFRPLAELATLELSESDLSFLDAALQISNQPEEI